MRADRQLVCTGAALRSGPFKKCYKFPCFVEKLTLKLNKEAKTLFSLNLIKSYCTTKLQNLQPLFEIQEGFGPKIITFGNLTRI